MRNTLNNAFFFSRKFNIFIFYLQQKSKVYCVLKFKFIVKYQKKLRAYEQILPLSDDEGRCAKTLSLLILYNPGRNNYGANEPIAQGPPLVSVLLGAPSIYLLQFEITLPCVKNDIIALNLSLNGFFCKKSQY